MNRYQLQNRKNPAGAFTLIEILIVVIILGILAAIVVPQFSYAARDATASTLKSSVNSVQALISHHYHLDGAYAATIDASWFASNQLPSHPENIFGVPSIQTLNTPGTMHPTLKVLKTGVAGAFWYNPAEGVFRARVADQGSSAATLDLYNEVNGSNEAALGNYGGGGGS